MQEVIALQFPSHTAVRREKVTPNNFPFSNENSKGGNNKTMKRGTVNKNINDLKGI